MRNMLTSSSGILKHFNKVLTCKTYRHCQLTMYHDHFVSVSHSSRKKRGVFLSSTDFSINARVIRCFYRGCEPPQPPMEVTELPSHMERWSDPATWINFTADGLEPSAMDDLYIPKGLHLRLSTDKEMERSIYPSLKQRYHNLLQLKWLACNFFFFFQFILIKGRSSRLPFL